MTDARAGLLAMIGACTIWGLSPLYYKLLASIPPLEVLAHRTLWSLAFFASLLFLRGRIAEVEATLRSSELRRRLTVSALAISSNWFLFIYSIQIARATEASLGYYIFPLVAVLLGVVAFGERLTRTEIVAVALAAVAVTVLAVREGQVPYVSLVLAMTFGIYGLAKKRLTIGAVVSVTTEVAILAPLALGWLAFVHLGQGGGTFGHDLALSGLLMLSGPLTALPLILFSFASQRIALSTVGLMQYLNPTLQFLCATLVFREPFGLSQALAFALIWTALALYSGARLSADATRRRAAVRSSTDVQD
ncbi:EamA-like transporter family protein [Roseivivax jejudonensis]|uniref:EamA-like transporter family protein n=1 Tax=Roseivivax jejudonensis TaxID=1529041 RepID=A0A1X6YNF8_9RHOB|nr:EamA family transporter RarD [Roseivivax jejudonensis]SLN26579.1 EamA-like transporter family protein [Roseivivax jejudonensis]